MDPSSPPDAPTTCFHHPDRVTGRRCTRCGRPACPDCLHQASVGSHCWQCIKAAAPPTSERVRRAFRGEDLLVTKALIAVNVAMFIPTVLTGGLLGRTSSSFHDRFALSGFALAADEWYRLFTSGFLHFGILHLGMNMYILYMLGQTLEAGVGRLRYLTIYVVSLLGGSFGATLLSPGALTAGASGAVFGLAAAATVALSRRGVPFANTGWGPVLVVNLVFTFAVSGISIGGHVGGLLVGATLGFLMLDPRSSARPAAAYGVAAAIAIVCLVGSIGFAQKKYGDCTPAPFERGTYFCTG
jgi:membrane associated rhomboid family serine protease